MENVHPVGWRLTAVRLWLRGSSQSRGGEHPIGRPRFVALRRLPFLHLDAETLRQKTIYALLQAERLLSLS